MLITLIVLVSALTRGVYDIHDSPILLLFFLYDAVATIVL